MFRYLSAVVALVFSLQGCATYPDVNQQRLESLPNCFARFDATLAWEVKDTAGGTVIDGVIKNTRFGYMEDVEVWVALLDAKGKPVARNVAFIIPQQMYLDEVAPFTIKLPRAEPGAKMRFTYKYRGSDGGSDGGGMGPWVQSFETKAPARQ